MAAFWKGGSKLFFSHKIPNNYLLRTIQTSHTAWNSGAVSTKATEKLNSFFQWYEDMIGLSEVREAQNKVIVAEKDFLAAQERRLEQREILNQLQMKLRDLGAELDKLNRGDPKFLEAITKQHALFRQENAISEKHSTFEKEERAHFTELSNAVRESHESERARAERTKYWSVIGSFVGALIGMSGAMINNYLRNREIKKLGQSVQDRHDEIESILVDFKSAVGTFGSSKDEISVSTSSGEKALDDKRAQELIDAIKRQDKNIEVKLGDIQQLILSGSQNVGDGKIVYVGPELEGMLNNTEKNLEYKIKINSLATVAFVYGAFAIAVPILYAIFRGGN